MMDDPVKRRIMLDSAKATLRSLPYYSIMPYLNDSQYLFEKTFNLQFITPFSSQRNRHDRNSSNVLYSLSAEIRQRILEVNDLDVQLFEYARELFVQRCRYARSRIT